MSQEKSEDRLEASEAADELRPDESGADVSAMTTSAHEECAPEADQQGTAEEADVSPDQDAEPKEHADSDTTPPVPAAEDAPVATQEADKSTAPDGHEEMTFTAHLNELRVRLVRCIVAAFVGFLACYAFASQLLAQLMKPLVTLLEPSGGALIYTGLAEAFFTEVKTAALAGIFVASPYIFYQIWMFIAPGLYAGERKYIIPIALCSALCFITGALFGYFIVFPFGFQFFLGYATDFIRPMPSVKEYFSFATGMLFAFGLIFELPLFMVFLSSLGVVTHQSLRKYRKYAILGNFLVGAILTPPDVISQCLMAGPLCLLYEVGIVASYIFGKKAKKEPPSDIDPLAPST